MIGFRDDRRPCISRHAGAALGCLSRAAPGRTPVSAAWRELWRRPRVRSRWSAMYESTALMRRA